MTCFISARSRPRVPVIDAAGTKLAMHQWHRVVAQSGTYKTDISTGGRNHPVPMSRVSDISKCSRQTLALSCVSPNMASVSPQLSLSLSHTLGRCFGRRRSFRFGGGVPGPLRRRRAATGACTPGRRQRKGPAGGHAQQEACARWSGARDAQQEACARRDPRRQLLPDAAAAGSAASVRQRLLRRWCP